MGHPGLFAQAPKTEEQKAKFDFVDLGKAPEKAKSKSNPFDHDPQAVTAGKLLFEEHCAECHGAGGAGTKKGPSLRAAEVQDATPGALFWLLTNGVVRKGMPVWSRLPEPQRWQLVSFLKSLGTGSETPKESPQPSKR